MIGFVFDLHLPVFIGIYTVVFSIFLASMKIRKKKFEFYRVLLQGAFIFYILALMKLVYLPIRVLFGDHNLSQPTIYDFMQLIPFKTIETTLNHHNYIQVYGNLLLLFPLPILLQLIFKKFSFFKSFLIVLSVTVFIEITQFGIDLLTNYPNKVMDIDDVILNTLGGIIGWFFYETYAAFRERPTLERNRKV
ncbi:VanZ family protein [Paenibacillus melissococcoides]|uniref:VanZ family protein n=1 Tax=Paenibacillus melissococcoides TaxID=2912268 RepID=A0ABM9G043_9BACL|nr:MULTISPECIES: VanZ family protein [Paenibacillus]MEB9894705.1 VanZ family protein [Bacillus cereus]CAH8244919.1 VanZ family protein [Paenibacillus melissococcoides]CAH8709366.1 VanZ family protein [Paenibacillus melissococcoides]CAH8710093.1 VanZ family protein [Paenibacillus melissococcoides]GIO79861.1 hypothetical protein J6TS7_34710 [Paenibacillus dendritiformis]